MGQSELMSQPDKDYYHETGVDFNGLYPIMLLYEVKIVCKSMKMMWVLGTGFYLTLYRVVLLW